MLVRPESLPREKEGGLREGDVNSCVSLGSFNIPEIATMVMLASYESSQHCAVVANLFTFTVEICISPMMERV